VVRLTWGTASLDSDQVNLADPQRIATTELGYTLTRPRGMLSAGIFENRISRLVRTIQRFDASAGTIISVDDNSGEWRTHGLELIAETRLIDPLSLSASLTWQQTDDRASSIDPGYSPRLLAKLKASWQQGPFTLGGYGNYVDGMDADWDFVNGPLPGITARLGDSMPGYWDLGLNLRWDPSGAGPFAALHVANLLNNEQRTPATELTELQRGLFGPGRTLTLTAGFDF
jgi:outer membrane receptor protein involved in Fe transport